MFCSAEIQQRLVAVDLTSPTADENFLPEGLITIQREQLLWLTLDLAQMEANSSWSSPIQLWALTTQFGEPLRQGLDIVKAIAKAGVKGGGADGAPNQPISINRVTVQN